MHKSSERNLYTENLFLARSCKILTKNAFLARFKKHNYCKIFARNEKVVPDCCKNFARFTFQFTNLARYVFLQKFCKSCFDCRNFARFLQKLFFLWTRVWIKIRSVCFEGWKLNFYCEFSERFVVFDHNNVVLKQGITLNKITIYHRDIFHPLF